MYRWRRVGFVLFGAAAAALVPWIVVLVATQPRTAVADRMTWVHTGLLGVVLAGTACCLIRPAASALAGPATATFALTVAWFFVMTRSDAVPPAVTVSAVAVLVLTAAAVATTATTAPGPRPRVLRWCLLALLAAQAVFLVRAAVLTPRREQVDHLKAAWVGLDVAEAVALALLARALRDPARSAVSAGSVTAALLTVDAFINVSTVTGLAQLEAVAMAVVELALAAAALVIPRRVASSV